MSSTALRSFNLGSFLRPAFLFILALILTAPLFADSHVRIVRLSYLDGDVEIDKGDGRGFNTAYLNMPVLHQSKVWARDGQAEVELEDGSSIRLTPDTIVAFNDLSLDNNGGRSTSIDLQQGTAYFDIHRHDGDYFSLQFGRDRIALEKSARFRVDIDKHDINVAVMNGEIEVSNASGTQVSVKKNETIRLDSDDPDRYYLAKGVDAETYDGWDSDRAKYHDQAVSTASNGGVVYGMTDLTAYGNYFLVPGYGYVWRPASAGLGWDPFADGYWVSYPGIGYTFVSGYPWGWAPYRYGSWQFVNGYGWCWAPGSNWNSWHAVPPLQHMPPHFHPPLVPHRGEPVMAVNNGVNVPVPSHGIYVDNDSLEHHRPHSTRITTDSGVVVRQTPSVPAVSPGQGLVAPASVPGAGSPAAPVVSVAPVVRPVAPRFGGPRRGDDDHDRSRGAQWNMNRPVPSTATMGAVSSTHAPAQTTVAPPQTTVAPAPAMAPPARMAPTPRMTPMQSPRMESHSSAPAPAMRPMSSPSAGMSSGGGMRMSSPSASSSMGGGARGGGGGGGSSHASHH